MSNSAKGKTLNLKNGSESELRALETLLRSGPATLILIYSTTCPHCHTYMPIWNDLSKIKGKKTNMVKMDSDVYRDTPLAAKNAITSVPSVIYIDKTGKIAEVDDIRNTAMMSNIVKEAVPEQVAAVPDLPEPVEPITTEDLKSLPLNSGVNMAPNPLSPVPATISVSQDILQAGGDYNGRQRGGNPWAAFLLAAQQAAPAAALLGAYSALPKRSGLSSGLPRITRRRRGLRRRKTIRRRR